jgi:cell division septal protein FtsQ
MLPHERFSRSSTHRPSFSALRRSVLLIAVAAGALLLFSAASWAPPILRQVAWFSVERVEVSGMRLLAPHEVLQASGVRRGQNLWDEVSVWESALRAHPVIAGAKVTRDHPHTLRIQVEEERPVGLVQEGALRPATATGALLPIDPARAPVNLPIIRAAAGEVTDMLLAETGRLLQLDPGLMARVSEVQQGEAGSLRLTLSSPVAEVLLPPGVGAARLARLRAVLADVEGRLPQGEAGSRRSASVRLDLRFGDQIVVRFPSSV